MLGVAFYIDESTMWFKGCNADKMNITYKAEGDGFQADTICQKLYIYQIFVCNDPLPKTHLDKIMLPIHDIVLALIDYVEGKHH